MNGPPSDGLLGLISSVAVALIGYLAVRATSKAGKRAGDEQETTERAVISANELVGLVSGYEGRLHLLEEGHRKTVADLAKTKQDLDGMHDWKRAAIRYIRALRQHSLHHSPGEQLPEPPAELLVDLQD